jgi:hypothetical protein
MGLAITHLVFLPLESVQSAINWSSPDGQFNSENGHAPTGGKADMGT